MFNPLSLEKYAKARQEEFLRWAEQERLVREARRTSQKQLKIWHCVICGLGQLMVLMGYWLQARHKPIL